MRKVVHLIVIIGMLSLAGCTLPNMIKLAKQQNLTVTPNPLEVHKDTVAYEMAASLPVKMLKKGTVYTLNSFYKYGDKEMALPPIPFKGDDYPAAATEQPKVTKSFSFAYQPAYKSGTLQVEGVAQKGTKTKTTSPRMDVAVGVITTSKLVQNSYYAAWAEHGYNNKEEITPVVIPDFNFEQGKSTLRPSETKSDKGKQLDAFIASKNLTRTVSITGTHSPEGRERINSKLSEERAKAIEKFYRAEMKKYDYKGMADSIKFILKPVVDDWNEFKNALAGYSGVSADEKSAYLNIINSGGSFEDQEKQMKKIPSYKKVFKEVYPKLRAAKTEILTVKKKKTDAEISVLAKQITQGASNESLTAEELMYAGTLTPSLEEKLAIYEASTKKAATWNAHNNLGAAYLQMAIDNPARAGEFADKAQVQLDLAAKIKETPEVNANLATVSLMKGNPYKAASYANKALNGASNDVTRGVNGVKGAAEIYAAKYDAAVRSESSASTTDVNLFNKGLAQLLSKDYANALNSFNEATSKNANLAIGFYGAAVASARSGNADGVVSNLSKAVKADPTLKDKALTDLEFSKYATTQPFRDALK
jgi:outer membrane protein OmpA-like peptidoglycan-associated protein